MPPGSWHRDGVEPLHSVTLAVKSKSAGAAQPREGLRGAKPSSCRHPARPGLLRGHQGPGVRTGGAARAGLPRRLPSVLGGRLRPVPPRGRQARPGLALWGLQNRIWYRPCLRGLCWAPRGTVNVIGMWSRVSSLLDDGRWSASSTIPFNPAPRREEALMVFRGEEGGIPTAGIVESGGGAALQLRSEGRGRRRGQWAGGLGWGRGRAWGGRDRERQRGAAHAGHAGAR